MPKNKNSYWAERARKDKIKVINTGEKGIDNLKRLLLLNLKDVEKQIGIKLHIIILSLHFSYFIITRL